MRRRRPGSGWNLREFANLAVPTKEGTQWSRHSHSSGKRVTGGSFLIEDLTPEDIFTLEDLTPEQKQIAEWRPISRRRKIVPQADEIEGKKFELSRKLMRELGELGLLGMDVPESTAAST